MTIRVSKAHEKLANKILEDFQGRITGDNVSYVVGNNPENVFFVGKLLSTKNENANSTYSSDVNIDSIGVDFYLSEEAFSKATVKVYPKGDFYYRAYPTLEQQRKEILTEIYNSYAEHYESFEEFMDVYNQNPSKYSIIKRDLVPVYKKVQIHSNQVYVQFKPNELFDSSIGYGFLKQDHFQNVLLKESLVSLQNDIDNDDKSYRYVIKEKVKVKDLISEETYVKFLKNNGKKDVAVQQNWSIYIDVLIKKLNDKYLLNVSLVNDSSVAGNEQSYKSNSKAKDKTSIETLFNSGLEIVLENAQYAPVILDYFKDDYKYDKEQAAIGANCSIEFNEETNTITTQHLPLYIQKRLITNDSISARFIDLYNDPISVLSIIKGEMEKELNKWKAYYRSKEASLTIVGKENMKKEIDEFELEYKRFKFGIDVIKDYPMVYKSFILMNKSFLNTSKKYDSWRLFQIVYIVSIIPDIVACDENLMTDEDKSKTTLGNVSLLYFPTGGGKTEAFLGVLVFNLFFDRFRGKTCGVTSILRYPLRLLSVQQVQRLANVLAQAELLRRDEPSISNFEPFSLGYFAGDKNTDNTINRNKMLEYCRKTQKELDEGRIIDICPFCGKRSVHLKFDRDSYRLAHYCDNPDCKSDELLPIYIVDNEIYRFLPSAIISTIDKLAILGNNANFRNILTGASRRCPKHGFTSKRTCLVERGMCNVEVQDFEIVDMYDPAPTLFIQDELHLIRESLGTYASHYESFIDYYVNNISKSKRKIKVIGATATISSYKEQVSHIYCKDPIKFPCSSPYPNENFYSHIDDNDTQRFILGYAPYGKAIINSVVYSLKYMREVVYQYLKEPELVLSIPDIGITTIDEAKKLLEDYWIFLEYNNVKRDGNNVEGALETPINVELNAEGIPPFISRKMTGDESFQDVREVLAQVENETNVFDGTNLIVATSMISHGVDADRFNIMFFYGMPGNTAEYIQAYSRTGRKHSSIVVDIMRPSRETDQSYLKNFVKFHEYKDIMVDAVPVNRWANKAISGTLPGIFAGLLLNKYDLDLQYKVGSLFVMNNIKKAILSGFIEKDIVKKELYESYRCTEKDDVKDIGNMYKNFIDDFVNNIFSQILDRNWIDEMLFDGFNTMGYHIMNSLRDTDTQLIIELE